MKVELDFKHQKCRVTREPKDKAIPYSGWVKEDGGDPNSRLYYRIKEILNEQGYGLIKIRMWKDGHMVNTERQYLVTRNRKGHNFCIYDHLYALRDARDVYNKEGEVTLHIEMDDGMEWMAK